MRYSAEIEINATADKVWEILTNNATYPELHPKFHKVEGKMSLGEAITITGELNQQESQIRMKVVEFLPKQKMTWKSVRPLGDLKAERVFSIESSANGVLLKTWEDFGGFLLPFFSWMLPDFNVDFAQFLAAVKKRAEGNKQ